MTKMSEKMRIGIISDTHGLLREEVIKNLEGCGAILHAGDIDRPEVLERLREIAPVYAVRGNADKDWAEDLPVCADVTLAGVRICMAHKKKDLPADTAPFQMVICGHTHRCEETVRKDVLFLNPGSCGPGRGKREATMALAEVRAGQVSVRRITLETPSAEALRGLQELKRTDVEAAMKMAAKGKSYPEIAAQLKISEDLAGQICRMYFTHPGVDADGIMRRLGL